jgi:hypothetical protein
LIQILSSRDNADAARVFHAFGCSNERSRKGRRCRFRPFAPSQAAFNDRKLSAGIYRPVTLSPELGYYFARDNGR